MVVIVEGGRDEGRKVVVLGSDEKGIKERWPHTEEKRGEEVVLEVANSIHFYNQNFFLTF